MKRSLTLTLVSLVLTLCVLLPGWAALAENEEVYYVRFDDFNYETITSYKTIKNSNSSWYDLTSGKYVVKGNVTLSSKTTLRITGDVHLILCDGSTLTVGDGVYIKNGSSLSIYGQLRGDGKLVAKPKSGPGIGGMNNTRGGNLYIHGGVIEAKGGTNAAGIGGGNHDSGYGDIVIYNGKVTAEGGSSGAGIGKGQQNSPGKCGSIQIYGGTVNATGGSYGAGIGGGEDRDGGNITIHGGTVNATGGRDGAGIGGGEGGSGGNITIHDGTITAGSKGQGAGIGGGEDGDSGTITIDSGWITATGGKNGAGIGGGERGNGQAITIRGHWITAKGGGNGAGIGGGSDGNGGNITIANCNVEAESTDGAGIGGGKGAGAGTITIESGSITATSDGGAGIGGGKDSGRGTITINGGTIIAKSHTDGAGIGGGHDADFIGKVSITEGSVTAKGDKGAAIGAGNSANFKGTVNVSGGSIDLESRTGAGIGAGCEGSLGDGGECSGDINISGGWVKAVTGGNRIYPISMAVGCGHNGNESGNLSLYLNAEVKGGYNEKTARAYGWGERIDGCHEAYAVITPGHAYIIGFKANGGTGEMAKGEPEADGKYIVPENGFTAPKGMEFVGWLVDGEVKQSGDEITVTTETDLIAQWQALAIEITFDANGGEGEMEAGQPDEDGNYTLPECGFTAPEGMEFAGWLVDGETLPAGDAIIVSKSTVLVAQWREIEAEPTEAPVEEPTEAPAEEPVVPPTEEPVVPPTEESVEQPAEEAVDQPEEETVEQPAEEAVEQPTEESIEQSEEEVVEQPAEESVEQPAEESVEQPEEETVEQPAEESVEQPAEEPAEEPVEQPVEAPADAQMCTITFDGGGADGKMAAVQAALGSEFVMPECEFYLEGCTFDAWLVNDMFYHAGDVITVEGDMTAMASWLFSEDGEIQYGEGDVEYGEGEDVEASANDGDNGLEIETENVAEENVEEADESLSEEPSEVGSVFSGAGIAAIVAAVVLALAAGGIAVAKKKKQ